MEKSVILKMQKTRETGERGAKHVEKMANIGQHIAKAMSNTTLTGGGLLPKEQSDQFVQLLQNIMSITSHARVETIRGSGYEVSSMDFSGRGIETEGSTGTTRKATHNKVTLSGSRIKISFEANASYLEENIEAANGDEEAVLASLTEMFMSQMANESEELLIEANTLGHAMIEADYLNNEAGTGSTTQYVKDSTFAVFDGIVKQLFDNASTYNAANSSNLIRLIRAGKKQLPKRYRTGMNKDKLRAYMPSDLLENLRSQLGDRATDGGDTYLREDGEIRVAGILCVPLAMMETNPRHTEHKSLAGTTAQALDSGYIDEDNLVVTPQALAATATAEATNGAGGYVVVENAGTVARGGSSALADPYAAKITYQTAPLFFITTTDNLVIGFNEQFKFAREYDAQSDAWLSVLRTRISVGFQDYSGVVLVHNVLDSLTAS